MIVLSERNQVKQAIQRWIATYGLDRTYSADHRGRRVGAELAALDPETATAAQVAEIIGTRSWVYERVCDECGVTTWYLVSLDLLTVHESDPVYLCRNCLNVALQLLDNAHKHTNQESLKEPID